MKENAGSRAATFILVLLLALGIACGTSVLCAYAAQPTASIASEDNLSAEVGGTVVMPINISDNPGIMGMGLTVNYDADVLTPVSVAGAALTSEGQFDDSIEALTAGSFKIVWAHSENITGNGTLFNVTFRVSEYAEGDTTVSLGFMKKDTFNEDFDDVTLACTPAIISITPKSPAGTTVRGGTNLSANDGSEIDVPILIDNVDGVESLGFALSYDTSVFTYEGVTAGLAATCEANTTESGCSVNALGINAGTTSGTLLTLKFKVAEYTGGNFVFGLTSDDVATRDFRVKVVNTHSNENAIILGGEIELSGSELTVPVRIANNHGIAGFRFTMKYDGSVLEPVSATKADVLTGSFNNTIGDASGSFDVLWTGTDNYTENGVLYTVKFNVLNAAGASAKINMSYSPADTCDENANDVLLTMNDIDISLSAEPILESISVEKTKTTYTVGDELNVDDIAVTATYSDGSTAAVTGWTSDAASVDMSTAGSKALTITYSEGGVAKTCEVGITVEPAPQPTLASIAATKTKTTYTVGDELNVDDVAVTATYSDGASKVVEGWTSDAASIDMSTAGSKALTISYSEGGVAKTCEVGITVEQAPQPVPVLSSINAYKDKKAYTVGDELDVSDVTVIATYSDDSIAVVSGWTSDADQVDMSSAGIRVITVTYVEGDKTATCSIEITVEAAQQPVPTLSSIKAYKDKTAYMVGDELDFSDVTVLATYSDGSSKAVEGWTSDFASVDMSTAGAKSITISYAEGDISVTCAVSITVEATLEPEVVLSSISAVKAKTDYLVNDELGIDDIVVTATYSDGSTRIVEGWQTNVASIDMSTVGTKAIVVSYAEGNATVACSVSINVEAPSVERTLTHIIATKANSVYTVGDELAIDDVIVTAAYSDGSSAQVTGWTSDVDAIDMTSAGTKILTITYVEDGISVNCTLAITVSLAPEPEATLASISASKGKTVYMVGDELLVDDVVVTAVYSDSSSKVVTGWVSNAESIDMSTAGAKTIAIAYTEREVTVICAVTINVEAAPQPEPTLSSINASKDKTTYRLGDALSIDDITVTATYSDGSSKVVDGWQSDAASIDMETEGTKALTIVYAEGDIARTCTIEIIIETTPAPILESISAEKVKTVYTAGEKLTVDDVTVTATYSDGSSKVVTGWTSTVANYDVLKPGSEIALTFYYSEPGSSIVSCDVRITVNKSTVHALSHINAFKDKVDYAAGEALNVDDVTVRAVYTDGEVETIDGWTSNAASIDMSTAGTKALIISYTEGEVTRTCTVSITVSEQSSPGEGLLYLDAEPNDLAFVVGGELDLSSVKIVASYYDKDDVEISLADCEVDMSEVDMSEVGYYPVKITYTENGVSEYAYVWIDVRYDITKFNVKIDETGANMYLFGLPLMPTVTIDGLEEGRDYTVTYANNTNAGEGKVIITGIESYGGTIVRSFTIAPAHVFLMVPSIKQSLVIYTGKAHKPKMTFAFSDLVQGRDYKLTYKNNVNIGEASIVVTGLGNYTGNYTIYFDILPAKATISKAKSIKPKTIKVVPKKQPGGVKYQVGYRLGKKGAWKYKTIKKKGITLKKLKKGKKYQVRIRAFKKVGGETYYGAWSKTKKVKVK